MLHDLIRIAVIAWYHRPWEAAGDASVPETKVFPGIGRSAGFPGGGARCSSIFSCGRQGRNLAVRRVDDQPGLLATLYRAQVGIESLLISTVRETILKRVGFC